MSQTHGSPVTITKTKSEIESLAEDSDGNVILGSEWIKNLPVGEYTVTETISDSEAMKLANIKAYKPNGFVGDSSLADFDAKKAVELTAVYNSPSDRKDFAAAFSTGTSAITWHIGEHKDGKPSKCSYRDTNFTETVVTNGKKEVDPDKSKNNGKNYLNAQIGKAIFENKVTAGSVEVQKVDNYNHALEGVVFTLHKADNGWNVTGEITELTTTKTEPHSDESPAIVLFKNLKPGSYIIKEKSAPDGYIPVTVSWRVMVDANGDVSVTEDNPSAHISEITGSGHKITVKVENEMIYNLPSSGSIGTYIFSIIGSMLLTAAVIMYLRLKRSIIV